MSKIRPLQETILINGTSFTNRNYSIISKNKSLNQIFEQSRQFKEDCNFIQLKETLPELFTTIDIDAKLILWQMREYNNTFILEMSEEPMGLNVYKSIDPYVFLDSINYN